MTTSTHKPQAAFDPSEWITQADAARERGVTRQAMQRLVHKGRLSTMTVGGRTFVKRSEVLALKPLQAGRPKKRAP